MFVMEGNTEPRANSSSVVILDNATFKRRLKRRREFGARVELSVEMSTSFTFITGASKGRAHALTTYRRFVKHAIRNDLRASDACAEPNPWEDVHVVALGRVS